MWPNPYAANLVRVVKDIFIGQIHCTKNKVLDVQLGSKYALVA